MNAHGTNAAGVPPSASGRCLLYLGNPASGFLYGLACDMLRNKCKDKNALTVISDFVIYIFLVIGEFPAESDAHIYRFLMIFNYLYPAENNNAAEAQRPFAVVFSAAVANAEGSFVTVSDSVDLMSFSSAVKKSLPSSSQ